MVWMRVQSLAILPYFNMLGLKKIKNGSNHSFVGRDFKKVLALFLTKRKHLGKVPTIWRHFILEQVKLCDFGRYDRRIYCG